MTGKKFDLGKLRFSLIPMNALNVVINVLMIGSKKYSDDNWQFVDNHKERYYNATMRHLTAWWLGESNDKETGLSHLAHAICCLLFLLWFQLKEEKEE